MSSQYNTIQYNTIQYKDRSSCQKNNVTMTLSILELLNVFTNRLLSLETSSVFTTKQYYLMCLLNGSLSTETLWFFTTKERCARRCTSIDTLWFKTGSRETTATVRCLYRFLGSHPRHVQNCFLLIFFLR